MTDTDEERPEDDREDDRDDNRDDGHAGEVAEEEHAEDFLRDAHPASRIVPIGLWVAMPFALALQHRIGIGVSIIICVGLLFAFISLRDKLPTATPNDGLFWRIAMGMRIWRAGDAPPETAKSIDLFGKIGMGLALAGVALTAWLGPIGLGATLAYLVVTIVKHRMLASLGGAAPV